MKTLPLLLALCLVVGCNSHSGRIKTEGEGDLVGSRSAGSATYERLIAETTRKLLDEEAPKVRAAGQAVVAFVGVENRSAEELGDISESTYEMIDTVLVDSDVFTNVSRRYVDAALRETGQRPEGLFLSDGRSRFLAVLRREGVAPDYLIFAKYTSASTAGEGVSQRNYLLTLEMVDCSSGLIAAKETSKVSKEYTR